MKTKALREVKGAQLAQKRIEVAGFPFMKFELEAQLWRDSHGWDERKCQKFIDDFVGPELQAITVYRKFYCDGSVDSELTITLPTSEAHKIVKWMEAFTALSKTIGRKMDTGNAGLHIAVLSTGMYPCTKPLDSAKRDNFVEEVHKILPALLFVSSHNYQTRGLRFRKPIISAGDKYSAIHIIPGGFEYRLFDTCYDRPEAVYEKIETVAHTLKYYSKQKNRLKLTKPISLKNGGAYRAMYDNPEILLALDNALKYIKPRYKTLDQMKKERKLELNGDKLRRDQLKAEALEDQKLRDAIALWEKRARVELRQFKLEIKDKKGWKSLETDDEKALGFLIDRDIVPRKPTKEAFEYRRFAAEGAPVGGYTIPVASGVPSRGVRDNYVRQREAVQAAERVMQQSTTGTTWR